MRIDQVQVAAINLTDRVSVRRDPTLQKPPEKTPPAEESKASVSQLPTQTQISVSVDMYKNVIYQFLDMRTGEVLQQVPPEQVLQVMRSIADQLRQSERKLEVTV